MTISLEEHESRKLKVKAYRQKRVNEQLAAIQTFLRDISKFFDNDEGIAREDFEQTLDDLIKDDFWK